MFNLYKKLTIVTDAIFISLQVKVSKVVKGKIKASNMVT